MCRALEQWVNKIRPNDTIEVGIKCEPKYESTSIDNDKFQLDMKCTQLSSICLSSKIYQSY